MKTSTSRHPLTVLITTLVLAVGTSVALSLTVAASDAPLKGAERLNKISTPATARPVSSTPAAPKSNGHAQCSSCQMIVAPRAHATMKAGEALAAGGKSTVMVAQHGCGGCSTRIETTGHGKAKSNTAVHDCSRSTLASAQCCQ